MYVGKVGRVKKKRINYYPFGLEHEGYNSAIIGRKHNYDFLGQERQKEFGLGWMDFHARNYDPALGRFMSIDILSELTDDLSVYHYAYNNPCLLYTSPSPRDS